ncbi:MAG: GtrA family protein [Actinobacteria bacterium]|nr:GtrA family protein [Actinomycetota bacterium]
MPTPELRPSLLDRLRAAMGTLYRELVKFGIIGGIAFVIDMGSFNLLRHTLLQSKPTTATLVSAALATGFAWIGNRMWTFRHRRNRPPHHEAVLFLGTNGVAMLLQIGIVGFSHYVLQFQSLAADNASKLIGIVLGTILRFWAYRTFVFAGEPRDRSDS